MYGRLPVICSAVILVVMTAAGPAVGVPRAIGIDELVNTARDGLALKGYDPVAYFDGAPVAGDRALEYEWNGARYRFRNAANRDRFRKDPAAFVPRYGGFCAYAVSRGYTADVDPLAWAVVDGKLYLNYSKRVRRLWQEDIPGNILKGDANWPSLRGRR